MTLTSNAPPTVEYLSIDANTGNLGIGNIPPIGEDYFEVPVGTDPNDVYLNEGVVYYYPPRPGPEHYWSFDIAQDLWIDTRDPEVELLNQRSTASMTRPDFVLAIMASKLIPMSNAEAGQAARGEIPAPFEAIIATLPPGQQLEAVVRWSGATVIERINPILSALALALGLTDEQLDALFGISL